MCSTAISRIAIAVGDNNAQCGVAEETASFTFQKLCERGDVKSGVRDGSVKLGTEE
jgi:hypothetical protein